MVKKAVKLIVQGTVQGVFFRNFCKEHANKLGLRGYVRNLENGDVELRLEGEAGKIEEMVKDVQAGPAHARIRNVTVEEVKWTGEFSEFKVLRF